MIVVQLSGNIGEQLFQYAAARNFSIIYNCDLLVDITWFVKNKKNKVAPKKIGLVGFNTKFGYAGSVIINNFLRKKENFYYIRYPETVNYKVIRENKKEFTKELYATNPPFLMSGDFKSETYFEENIEQIKEDLTVNIISLKKIRTLIETIEKTNSIAVFIPKQFVNKNQNVVQNEIDFDYYQNAIEVMEKKIQNPYFFFFTDLDSIELDKLNLQSTRQFVKLYEDELEWQNVFLMSKCKHFIGDNSATSWWAGWLNFNVGVNVILPKSLAIEFPEITHNKLAIQQNWIKI